MYISTLLSLFAITSTHALPTTTPYNITPTLYSTLEELSRIVDITYCVGTPNTGIVPPFTCLSRCSDFPTFELVQSWNTGPLFADSCGYIALDHDETRRRILVAFRGTYSVANAIVDLSTGQQEYVPYPPSDDDDVDKKTINKNDNKLGNDGKDGGSEGVGPGEECMGCAAHIGFLASWKLAARIIIPAMQDLVAKYPDYAIIVIGHSLGGAVAGLAGLEFMQRGWNSTTVTTFGEPRIGNEPFASYINTRFGSAYRRVTHKSDPVPLLPLKTWGFTHHQTEFFIDRVEIPASASDIRVCEGDEDQSCAAGGSLGFNMLDAISAHRDYFNRLGLCVPSGIPKIGPWKPIVGDWSDEEKEQL